MNGVSSMSNTIQPLGKRVLIKRSDAEKTSRGIILPDSAQDKPNAGTVIAVGPGSYDDQGVLQTLSIKEGQTVLYGKYAGTEVNHGSDEETYLLVAEDDILATIE